MTPRKKIFRLPWRSARQIRSDVDEELRFHLDTRIDALVGLGKSTDDARRQALREFGDLEDARRYIRAVDHDIEATQRRRDFMGDLLSDIAYAFRKLRSTPAFTLAAIATLALGVGANTAMFSVVNSVLLQPLPYPQADHLVRFMFTQQGHGDAGTPMDLVDYRTQTKDFTGISVAEFATANLVRAGADAERVQGVRVNANYFDILRATPLLGRFFANGEDAAGAAKVVVLSEQLWRRAFGADATIIGQPVQINGESFTVIGVATAEQRFPLTTEIWMPKVFASNELNDGSRGARWLSLYARLRDDVTIDRAATDVLQISEAMEQRFPEKYRERRAHLKSVQEYLTGDMRKPLLIMLGAVTLVLLIACANVANLMLVRATARESEMAVRTALGAGRGRLARQLMTEAVILSAIGSIVGLAVARLGMRALLAGAPSGLPRLADASIDMRTLIVTALIALITGVVFGVLPAIQAGRSDLASALRAGTRGTRSKHTAHRTKQTIVIAEVALAVTLLTGAGLLLHSFVKLLSVDPGFRPEGVLSMKVTLPMRSYDSTAARNFTRAVEERVRALPGAKSVALATLIPLDGGNYGFTFSVRGRPTIRLSDEPSTQVRQVSADFLTTMGIPVMNGRGISATDVPGTTPVIIVNRAFAQKFFPNENAIGQSIMLGWGEEPKGVSREIVGVVGDVRSDALSDEPAPTSYVPLAQIPAHGLSIVVRTSGDATSFATPLRGVIRDLDRDVPVYGIQTMEDRVVSSVGRQKFYATLIAIFAGIAVLLSAVGLYGVIAYAVTQRTHELGIRVALGASGKTISKMVIGEGLLLAGVGAAIGIVGSMFAGRVVRALLFDVTTLDPATLTGVVAVLGLVALLASWLPARRAARVDPLVAMRGD
jgi:predicted permease